MEIKFRVNRTADDPLIFGDKNVKVLVYIFKYQWNQQSSLYKYPLSLHEIFMITTAHFWECNQTWQSRSVHSLFRYIYKKSPQHKNVLWKKEDDADCYLFKVRYI